jgi:ribonuclease HII
MRRNPVDLLLYEREAAAAGYTVVAGVDEAGRGPLAGPVVAAAVIVGGATFDGLTDSKKLTEKARERLYDEIFDRAAAVGVGSATPTEIDRINILQASLLAMRRAVEQLPDSPDLLLVDGNQRIGWDGEQRTIVKGDALSLSVAAASVIAKVTRDRLMKELDARYPAYGFARHKGYPTADHRSALAAHGACPEHRMSFGPVSRTLEADE